MLRAKVCQPRQRLERVAHHQRTRAPADIDAIDGGDAGQTRHIQPPPIADRIAQHATAVEKIVGDECRHAERAVVCIAVVHDLDRRHYRTYRVRDAVASERRRPRLQIAREFDCDFALDPELDETGARNASRAAQHRLLENTAGAGVGDIQERLHHRGGAADLVADLFAHSCHRQQAIEHSLQLIALRFVPGSHGFRQVDDRRKRQPLIEQLRCRLEYRNVQESSFEVCGTRKRVLHHKSVLGTRGRGFPARANRRCIRDSFPPRFRCNAAKLRLLPGLLDTLGGGST